ncbi:hypothetical protein [Salinispora vitiensis]|uniref:hypothetical protein n=1 Tax=Salinispora vitiensis TaxID=999544 RepID=UPI0003802A18|nr:hypothetical protein [Salinispora vitiensis]
MNKANDWNRPYWQALDVDLRAAAGRIAAFDITAAEVKDGPSWARRACGRVGELRVTVSTRITAPENAELVALRARAELEAERTGGTR